MSENRRLDESLSVSEFIKSLTGSGTTSIDLSSVQISSSGEMQPAPSPPVESPQPQITDTPPTSSQPDSD